MSQRLRIAASAAALMIACSVEAATVAPPAAITSAGNITYCSDISGPPLGYFDENNTAVGSHIDIGTEIANRFGVKAEFKNTAFSAIIPSLQAKQSWQYYDITRPRRASKRLKAHHF